jgi:cobalt-zinc-cadmium efflux system membrane fusion protein
VFVAEGTRYRRQTVTTGRDDGRHVQIVAGLPAGALVVARNAFVLQSELEKSASEE